MSSQPAASPNTDRKPYSLVLYSNGGGQDSTALIYMSVHNPEMLPALRGARTVAALAGTGDEHGHTVMYQIAQMNPWMGAHGIENWYVMPGDDAQSRLYADQPNLNVATGFHLPGWRKGLAGFYDRNSSIGSKAGRQICSDQLKISPLYKWLEWWVAREYGLEAGRKQALYKFVEQYGKIAVVIGFAKGEEGRCADDAGRPVWMRHCLDFHYPLIDLGMDRLAAQDYIRGLGYPVPYPSNCERCHWMSKIELLWLARNRPEVLADWMRQEQAKLTKFAHLNGSNKAVFGSKPLMRTLEDAEAEYGEWSNERLDAYKFSHGCSLGTRY